MRGFDVLAPIPDAAAVKQAGFDFVGRYLKNLTSDEVARLRAAGVAIVSLWEKHGDRFHMDPMNGKAEGENAGWAAIRLMQTSGSTIYAAVDFDASGDDLRGIKGYFTAFRKTIFPYFELGAYGNGLVLAALLEEGLITKAYLAGAMGWYGSREFDAEKRWHIKQHPTVFHPDLGYEIDVCEAIDGDFGQWGLESPRPLMTVKSPLSPNPSPIVPPARELQQALVVAGAKIDIDGVWGPQSAAALKKYYERQK